MSKLLKLFEQVIERLDVDKKLDAATKTELISSAEALIAEQTQEIKNQAEVVLKEQIEKRATERSAEVLAAFDEFVVTEGSALLEKATAKSDAAIKLLTEKFEADKATLLTENKVSLAKCLDSYLDTVVAEHLPEATVLNEARIQRLEAFYGNVRELAKVSNSDLQEAVAEKVTAIDGEAKLLKEQLDAALKAKIELKKHAAALEKTVFLNEQTKALRPKVAEMIVESAAKLTLTEVKEQFATLLERAEGLIDRRRPAKVEARPVVREQVLNEGKEEIQFDVMDTYVSMYTR